MENKSVVKGLVYGGVSSCVAECVTMPADVVKTRLQLDGSAATGRLYNGMADCALKLTRAEGPQALFKGRRRAAPVRVRQPALRAGRPRWAMGIRAGVACRLEEIVAAAARARSRRAAARPVLKVRLQADGMLRGADGAPLPRQFNECSTARGRRSPPGVLA